MDRQTFETRTAAQRNRLLIIAKQHLSADDCEDAVQSAVLSAWEHLHQLRDESAFDAWLTQILINQCRQIQREKMKKRRVLDALAQKMKKESTEEYGLQEALEQLSNDEKELLLVHHDQGYSIHEMSKMYGQSEDVMKMRLYRARRRFRTALISLLLLLLLAAAAVGMGLLDVNWFLQNRRASPQDPYQTDPQSSFSISYDGLLLQTEIIDVIWDLDQLKLLFTYSLSGTSTQALTVHSGNIGVDGEQFDHIWIDGRVLPVTQWADGKPVYCYSLDEWSISEFSPLGSEDYLLEDMQETFFCELRLNRLAPEQFTSLVNRDGLLTLTNHVTVSDYASHDALETGTLKLRIAAPDHQAWQSAYETYFSETLAD